MAERKKLRLPTGNTGSRLPHKSEESTRTVTVACKLPNGLILQLEEWVDVPQPGPGGTRMVKESRRIGAKYTVRGNRLPFGVVPDFQMTSNNNGYALTPGIPKEFWDQWLDAHKDMDIVVNKLIFACPTTTDVRAIARENEGRRSGLEPLDPAKLPMRQVATDEQTAKTLNMDAKDPVPISRGQHSDEAA
jgi:hypothetical protein